MTNPTANPGIAETRAAFFKRIVTIAVLTNLFFFGLAGFLLFQSRLRYRERAEITTQNLAHMFAAQIGDDVDKVDLTVHSVAEEVNRQLAGGGVDAPTLDAFINRQLTRLPVLDSLRLVNAQGEQIVGPGVNPAALVSVADRAYFQRLRRDPNAGLVISEPVLGRINQKWSIILAQRVNQPDGAFAGLVYGSITLDQFVKNFATVDVGRQGSISLRDEELAQVVRYPDDFSRVVGRKNGSPELLNLVRLQPEAGTYRSARSADHIPRTYSYCRVARRPYYMIVGLADLDVLAAWWNEAGWVLALGGVFLLGTLVVAWRFYGDWRRRLTAETHLRESEELYRKLFDLESDAVMLADCHTHHLVDANLAAQRLYGYSRDEFLQLTTEDISAEPDQTRAFVGSGSFVPLRWHRKKNGDRLAVEVTANQMDYRGRRMELATVRDVSQRQQVLDRLQDMTRQLVEAQHMAGLGSYAFDLQTGLWTGSEVLDKVFGLTDPVFFRDVPGWLQIIHPQDRAEMERYLKEDVLARRAPFDRSYRIVRLHDRQERWVHGLGKLILDGQGRVVRMVGIIQDITERKRAEEAQARLATVVEQATESIVITDPNAVILYVNPAF
jgi:PAS domain S-box-containing protein